MYRSLDERGRFWLWVVVAVLVAVAAFFSWRYIESKKEEKRQESIVLTQGQASNNSTVGDKLDLPKEQAVQTALFVAQSAEGGRRPVWSGNYITDATNATEASNEVSKKINSKDSSLPALALEKSDRTLVVPFDPKAKEKTGYDFGIYKIHTAPSIQRDLTVSSRVDEIQKPEQVNFRLAKRITSTDKKPVYVVGGVSYNWERDKAMVEAGIRW